MKIKNKRGPNTDPCGTPEFIFLQSDVWPNVWQVIDLQPHNL